MLLPSYFHGEEDFVRMVRLVNERLVPVLDWVEGFEDPQRRKVTAALFAVCAYNLVKRNNPPREVAMKNMEALYDAIVMGELDEFISQKS
jgi:hypothetical protein